MTKEELKQEAKKYARRKFDEQEQIYLHAIITQAYIDSAEPREKEIKSLGERCLQLQKDKGNLTDELTKAKELLNEFVFLLHNPRTALDTKTVMDKAEQFLNEVGK